MKLALLFLVVMAASSMTAPSSSSEEISNDASGRISNPPKPKPNDIGGKIGHSHGQRRQHHDKLSHEIRDAIKQHIDEVLAQYVQKPRRHHDDDDRIHQRIGNTQASIGQGNEKPAAEARGLTSFDFGNINGRMQSNQGVQPASQDVSGRGLLGLGGLLTGLPLVGGLLGGLPLVGGLLSEDEEIHGRMQNPNHPPHGGIPQDVSGRNLLGLGSLLSGLPLVGGLLSGLPIVGGLLGNDEGLHGRMQHSGPSYPSNPAPASAIPTIDVAALLKALPVGKTVSNLPLVGETLQKATEGLPVVGKIVTDGQGGQSVVPMLPLTSVVQLVQGLLTVLGNVKGA